jgi:hypothetical protein
MAQPAYIQKTLVMKPEVTKIFDDLDAWLDHCRFNLLPYNPADLYKSQEYRWFAKPNYHGDKKYFRKERKGD